MSTTNPLEKTIGVTGGAGFIGSHVINELVDRGATDVICIDKDHKQFDGATSFMADLTHRQATVLAINDCDIVIHLAAAVGGIAYFNTYQADILSVNTCILRNTFDAAKEADVDRFVYGSSSCVFDENDDPPDHESKLPLPPPDNAYGASKLLGETFCKAYHRQYGLEYTIFRPFNAVGPEPPGEEPGQAHVIPDLTKKILEERQHPLELIGSGQQVRGFTHVEDIARGIVECAVREEAAYEDFNLGNPQPASIMGLAEYLWVVCGRDEPFDVETTDGFEHDVDIRVPNADKAKEVLGWQPTWGLSGIVEDYVRWYRENVLRAEA